MSRVNRARGCLSNNYVDLVLLLPIVLVAAPCDRTLAGLNVGGGIVAVIDGDLLGGQD